MSETILELIQISGDIAARLTENSIDLNAPTLECLAAAYPEFPVEFWDFHCDAHGCRDRHELNVAATSFLQGYELARRRAEA